MLRKKAFLVIQTDDSNFVFEFGDGVEITRSITKSFIIGERGEWARLIWDTLADIEPVPGTGAERRTGFWLDGGMGSWTRTLTFETGAEDEDISWGDGSGGTGPNNVTERDASGPGVHKEDRADVFELAVAVSKTDSETLAFLHYNQWSDGTYGTEGSYGRPMSVVVTEASISTDTDDPSAVTGSVELTHAAGVPISLSGEARQILDDIVDFG